MVSCEVNKQPVRMQPGSWGSLGAIVSVWLAADSTEQRWWDLHSKEHFYNWKSQKFFYYYLFYIVKAHIIENTACGNSLTLLIFPELWDFYCPCWLLKYKSFGSQAEALQWSPYCSHQHHTRLCTPRRYCWGLARVNTKIRSCQWKLKEPQWWKLHHIMKNPQSSSYLKDRNN